MRFQGASVSGCGRRIAKAYDEVTVVKYLYDGDHCIAEYDGNDQLLRKYIYGPGVDQPLCMIDVNDSNAVYYYHYDGLGSVVALSDAAGDTVQLYEYSVYGQVAASDPNHPNPFLFTGRRFDTDTGLYYYRARYYNPYIGRFLQTDPARQGMNSYAYCGNNPIGCVDPSGSISIWRDHERGEGFVHVRWIDPKVYTPMILIAPPSGSVWSLKQFFWWYVNKGGAPLNFVRTGLVDKFMSDSLVAAAVEDFIAIAKERALAKFAEIDAQWREWLAWAAAVRSGGTTEVREAPETNVDFEVTNPFMYNFTPGRIKRHISLWPYLLDLVVLGKGTLLMSARINVQRFKPEDAGGAISISLNYIIKDAFKDVLDWENKMDDAVCGYYEYDDGHPYPIGGGWPGDVVIGVKEFAVDPWSWSVHDLGW